MKSRVKAAFAATLTCALLGIGLAGCGGGDKGGEATPTGQGGQTSVAPSTPATEVAPSPTAGGTDANSEYCKAVQNLQVKQKEDLTAAQGAKVISDVAGAAPESIKAEWKVFDDAFAMYAKYDGDSNKVSDKDKVAMAEIATKAPEAGKKIDAETQAECGITLGLEGLISGK